MCDDTQGWKEKGNTAFREGKFDEAVECFTRAIEQDPSNHVLYSNRSGAYASSEKYEAALIDGKKCVELNPQWGKGYARQGFAQLKLGQIQQAAMTYVHGLKVDPTNDSLMQGLTQCGYFPRGPFEPQPEVSTKNPDIPKKEEPHSEKTEAEKHNDEANSLYKQKQFTAALEAYDRAIEANPRELRFRNNKAAVYLEMAEYDKCIKECEEALTMRYEVKADFTLISKIFNRMGACYRKQLKYDQAIEMYEKSLMEDNNRHTRSALRETEAIRDKATRDAYIDPVLAEEHRQKGNDFFKAGDYPAAKKEYDEAIKRNPTDAKLYSNRAATYTNLLEYPSALADCEKSLELDPKFVKAWTRKATVHFRQKEYAKALSAYEKGLELEPENMECRNGLEATFMKIQQTSSDDPETAKRAMADPEIQQILSDPQFQLILQQCSENPQLLPEFLKDPKIARGIAKLRAAKIV